MRRNTATTHSKEPLKPDFCTDDAKYRCEHLDYNPLSQESFELDNGKLPARVVAAFHRGEYFTVCEECTAILERTGEVERLYA